MPELVRAVAGSQRQARAWTRSSRLRRSSCCFPGVEMIEPGDRPGDRRGSRPASWSRSNARRSSSPSPAATPARRGRTGSSSCGADQGRRPHQRAAAPSPRRRGQPDRVVCVVGVAGAGKTTALRAVSPTPTAIATSSCSVPLRAGEPPMSSRPRPASGAVPCTGCCSSQGAGAPTRLRARGRRGGPGRDARARAASRPRRAGGGEGAAGRRPAQLPPSAPAASTPRSANDSARSSSARTVASATRSNAKHSPGCAAATPSPTSPTPPSAAASQSPTIHRGEAAVARRLVADSPTKPSRKRDARLPPRRRPPTQPAAHALMHKAGGSDAKRRASATGVPRPRPSRLPTEQCPPRRPQRHSRDHRRPRPPDAHPPRRRRHRAPDPGRLRRRAPRARLRAHRPRRARSHLRPRLRPPPRPGRTPGMGLCPCTRARVETRLYLADRDGLEREMPLREPDLAAPPERAARALERSAAEPLALDQTTQPHDVNARLVPDGSRNSNSNVPEQPSNSRPPGVSSSSSAGGTAAADASNSRARSRSGRPPSEASTRHAQSWSRHRPRLGACHRQPVIATP